MNNKTINNLSSALISWYPFKAHANVLFLAKNGSVFESIPAVMREKGLAVHTKADDLKYDYIVALLALETSENQVEFLENIKEHLKPDGRILLGTYNRLALRFFCGDKDPFSGHVFDGMENYKRFQPKDMDGFEGRCFSKAEITDFLLSAGFKNHQIFSVMPTLERPQVLLRYGYKPNEALDVRVFPQYSSPESVFLEEEGLYASLFKNDMFHQMANGYLIECSVDSDTVDYDQITVQGDRNPDGALATVIKSGEFVEKKALFPEGNEKLSGLYEKNEELKSRGIPVVPAVLSEGSYRMPFVDGEIATLYLRKCLRKGKECFLKEIRVWKNMIEESSEHVDYKDVDWLRFEPGWEKRKADDPNLHKWEELSQGSEEEKADIGVILKHGYIDMVSLNCFHTDDGYKFFDQEFYVENFPANAILIRTVDFVYNRCTEMETIFPREELLKELKLFTHQKTWRQKGNDFLKVLRCEEELSIYHKKYRRDNRTVQSNRHRMDYPQDEYDRLFKDIFKGAENKKLYLFGSGAYSERFIEQFGQYYDIAAVLDNNSEKWGVDFHGIKISSPDVLNEEKGQFKVFICIKNYDAVLNQLRNMGIKDVSIYEHRLDYERPIQIAPKAENETPKPYHIGYVAGVFDVFHIGHLNLLRRAKELCDYLIAGVVSDEQVIRNKKTKPYMCFEDRQQIVAACRYVDEAVKIPIDRPGTEEAWRMYHFDAQFSGSDYENDPEWLAKREFLRQHGSELVFFPYTESTSSTKLKSKLT